MPYFNNASAMVQGLTYLLCKENLTLRRYLHQKYAEAGETLFDGAQRPLLSMDDIVKDLWKPVCASILSIGRCPR